MPLAVKFVVLAPPFMEKSPAVIVDDALERKPFRVERPERNDAPETEIAVVLAYGKVFAIDVEVAVK